MANPSWRPCAAAATSSVEDEAAAAAVAALSCPRPRWRQEPPPEVAPSRRHSTQEKEGKGARILAVLSLGESSAPALAMNAGSPALVIAEMRKVVSDIEHFFTELTQMHDQVADASARRVQQPGSERIVGLFQGMHFEARQEAMLGVATWLQGRYDGAEQELKNLASLTADRETEHQALDVDLEELPRELQSKRGRTIDDLRKFIGELRRFDEQLPHPSRREPVQTSVQESESEDEQDGMSVDDVRWQCASLRDRVADLELQVWTMLNGQGREAEAEPASEDVIAVCEERMSTMSAALKEQEGQCAGLEDALAFARCAGDVVRSTPQGPAAGLIQEIKGKLQGTVMRDLLNERRAKYGAELHPPDDSFAERWQEDADTMETKLGAVSSLCERLEGGQQDYASLQEYAKILDSEEDLPLGDDDGTGSRTSQILYESVRREFAAFHTKYEGIRQEIRGAEAETAELTTQLQDVRDYTNAALRSSEILDHHRCLFLEMLDAADRCKGAFEDDGKLPSADSERQAFPDFLNVRDPHSMLSKQSWMMTSLNEEDQNLRHEFAVLESAVASQIKEAAEHKLASDIGATVNEQASPVRLGTQAFSRSSLRIRQNRSWRRCWGT